MENPCPRKVAIDQHCEPSCPRHPSTLTPPPKGMQPCSGQGLAERVQAVNIDRHAVVVEVPQDDPPQPTADLGDWPSGQPG